MFQDSEIAFDWKAFGYTMLSIGAVVIATRFAAPYTIPRVIALFTGPAATLASASTVIAKTNSVAPHPIVYSTTTPWNITRTLSVAQVVLSRGKFIVVDQAQNHLGVYVDGALKHTYPIVAFPASDSPQYLPRGFYELQSKQKQHAAVIGKGYVSFALELTPNCFIHGDSYSKLGMVQSSITASSSLRSPNANCIQLSDKDAADVFTFADVGTPVWISRGSQESIVSIDSHIASTRLASITRPRDSSDAYLIADVDTGEVYLERNAKQAYPVASITKLMTALVAGKYLSLSTSININPSVLVKRQEEIVRQEQKDATSSPQVYDPVSSSLEYLKSLDDVLAPLRDVATSTAGDTVETTTALVSQASSTEIDTTSTHTALVSIPPATILHNIIPSSTKKVIHTVVKKKIHSVRGHDTFTVSQLLSAMLLLSNNAVADILAREYGFDAFIALMNTTAALLGMQSAHFADSSGLSGDNTASTYDLFTLVRYLVQEQSYVLDITHMPHSTIVAESGVSYALNNVNHPADQSQYVGGKVGETSKAEQTMVLVVRIPVGNTVHSVAIVVLRSPHQKEDVAALVQWITDSLQKGQLAQANTTCTTCAVGSRTIIP